MLQRQNQKYSLEMALNETVSKVHTSCCLHSLSVTKQS